MHTLLPWPIAAPAYANACGDARGCAKLALVGRDCALTFPETPLTIDPASPASPCFWSPVRRNTSRRLVRARLLFPNFGDQVPENPTRELSCRIATRRFPFVLGQEEEGRSFLFSCRRFIVPPSAPSLKGKAI